MAEELVLVTGAAGFIGSNLVVRLLEEGHRVVAVDDLSTGRLANLSLARAPHLTGRLQFDHIDVTSDAFDALVARMRPNVIFHLAAQVDVRVSVDRPLEDARLNVLGTIHVLEAARRHGVRRVVYAASIAGYGDPPAEQLPIDEQVTTPPLSPYGVSKRAAGDYVLAYGATHDMEGVVLTLANVYGPHQSTSGEGGVVAIFAGRMLEGAPCTIFGDGEQTRDFVFVDDVVDAFVRAGSVPEAAGERMLIGTGVATTVDQLYAECAAATGYDLPPVRGPERAGEVRHSVVDASRARTVLGWQPWTGVADGVRATIAWAEESARG
ncbi:MAG: NAD-dependent epimerase/dehydratase family protein [Actinomycetota bacterium]|nr:NAD-dependent epimerase/dehydratase family protein [Actinomycetota bacterium]